MKFKLFLVAFIIGAVFIVPQNVFAVDETTVEQVIANEYQGVGTAAGSMGDDTFWAYSIPFAFPFYGNDYNTAYINSNGMICFGSGSSAHNGDITYTGCGPFIAPFWTDLYDNFLPSGGGSYIEENADNVIIRWKTAEWGWFSAHDSESLDFEVVLYDNGNIKLNYGSQLKDIDSGPPVVGISKGDGTTYTLSALSGQINYHFEDTSFWGISNSDPTDIALSNDSVNENETSGTTVGTLSTADADAGDTHTYSFTCSTPGSDDSSFQLSGNSLQSNEIFDYETKASYDICVRTDDGNGGVFDKNFTININDVDEAIATITVEIPELEIKLSSIKNITETSLDLRVEVENYDDRDLSFKVKVTNKDTGDSYTLKLKEKVSDNGKATLAIGDLEPGTNYSFKVRVKEDDDYTDYSNSKKAKTLEDETVYTPISQSRDAVSETPQVIEEAKKEEKTLDPAKKEGEEKPAPVVTETKPSKERKEKKESLVTATLNNPTIKNTTAIAGLVAGAAAAGAASTATIPFMPLAPVLLRKRLSEALGLAHMIASSKKRFGIPTDRSKKEKYWGVVFDSYTKQPIEEVLVQLLDKEKRRVVDQTVTDESGRYGFLIAQDKEYELKIQKGAYEIDTKNTNDDLYGKIYTNPQIFKKETPIQLNIALDSKNFNWEKFARKMINQYTSLWAKLVKYTLDLVYIAGFGISVFAVIKYPSILNYIILASYGVFLVIRIIFKNRKQFGTIISKNTNKPLPFTVVELFDKNTNQRVNFTVSDILGRYYLLANNGNYKLKIKSMKTIDSPIEGEDTINVKDGMLREDFVV